jgi:membrane associated rhomboid family serine protease
MRQADRRLTAGTGQAASSGVAVLAHIGGFIAGCVLVIPFKNPTLVEART